MQVKEVTPKILTLFWLRNCQRQSIKALLAALEILYSTENMKYNWIKCSAIIIKTAYQEDHTSNLMKMQWTKQISRSVWKKGQ